MDDEELSRLLHAATPAPPPSAQELEAILIRHGRRWRPALAAMVAVAVMISATVVLVARSSGRNTERVIAGAALGPTQLAEAISTQPSPSPASQSPSPPITFERLFLRTTTGGVSIRAYLGTVHGPLPCAGDQRCPPPECLPHTLLHVGLSTETAVGEVAVPADGQAPPTIALVAGTGFGLPGVSASFALVVRAGAGVATLRMRFANGESDQMAPVRGWAVLARQGGSPFGTLEALDAAGTVIASAPIPPPQTGPRPPQPGQGRNPGGQPPLRCTSPPGPGGPAGQGGSAPGGASHSGAQAT